MNAADDALRLLWDGEAGHCSSSGHDLVLAVTSAKRPLTVTAVMSLDMVVNSFP